MHTSGNNRADLECLPHYSSKNRIFLSILGVRFRQMWGKCQFWASEVRTTL